MQKFKSFISLTIIFVISFLILSYKLNDIPNGIYLDEATTGYNAYSILKTGKDEYGKSYPIAFRFFGSYSPPLYTYLTTIPVLLFGLNGFSVRIISVVSGAVMTLVFFGFLKQTKLVNKKIIYWLLFLFIITPWNFFFARTGYEIYLGFLLFSFGLLVCWLSLTRKLLMPLGFAILSISTYAAHAQIYSVPIFVIGFLFLFYKKLNRKFLIVSLFLAFVIQVPHLTLLGSQAFINKSDLFYSEEILNNARKIILLPGIISIPLSFGYSFFSRIITFMSPYSLFFFADPDPQRSIPELSVFYSWMVIPFLIGIFIILKKIKEDFVKLLILLILVSIIPAALTKDPFSTQRGLSLLLPLFIIIGFGISAIFDRVKSIKFAAGFVLIFLISVVLLWRSYFVLLPAERAVAWNYGFKDIAKFIRDNPKEHFVVEQIHGKPSYIVLAFFLRTDPKVLQNSVDPKIKLNYYNLSKFDPDYNFENIETRRIKWEEDIYKPQILIGDELVVSETQAKEHFLKEVFAVNDPRDYPILKGFQTNPEKKCLDTAFRSEFCKQQNRN